MASKKEILEYYLNQGNTWIEINPSVKGLIIPKSFIKKGRTRMTLDPNETILTNARLETKLVFEDETHDVKIPYSSIYLVTLEDDQYYDFAISFIDCFPQVIRDVFSEEDYETLHTHYEYILHKILNNIPLKENPTMDRKQILLDHLAIAKTMIALDPSVSGVRLPKHLMDSDTVKLNLSNTSAYPMQFKEFEVIATLSFGGVPFECHIPYMSIFAVMIAGTSPEDAVVFDDSIPQTTKRMVSLYEKSSLDAMKFMSELEEQLKRDDIIIGNIAGTDKPQ